MTLVTVQAAFGYSAIDPAAVWTDITGWTDIATAGIAVTRGASDEISQIQPSTLSLTLDNSDGRFSPGRASSPYYPGVRKRTPIRVLVTVLGGINYVTNPSFDTSLTDWGNGPAPVAAAVVNSTHMHSGGSSCRITWAATGTGGTWQTTLYGLTIGAVYTASAWIWIGSTSPHARLVIDGSTAGALTTVVGAWTRTTVTWTATAASHTLGVTTATTSPPAGSQIWLDDVQVEQGATATTYSGTAATVHQRFYGAVTSWPLGWKGLLSTVQITASDLFAWLSRQPALQPMLVEEVLQDGPQAYYPLSEPDGSTSGGDISGYTRPSLTTAQAGSGGTLAFGQGTGPASDGLSTPLFTPASASAGKYLTTNLVSRLTDENHLGSYMFEAWFSTSTAGRVIMSWATTDPAAFENSITFLLDSATGHLQIEKRSGGTLATTTVGTPTLADGATHYMLFDDLSQTVYVDGTSYAVSINPSDELRLLTVGAYNAARLWSGTISHVAVYVDYTSDPAVLDAADVAGHYSAGTTGYSGESADQRIARLAGYAGITTVTTTGTFSAVGSQGQLGATALSHMQDVERTESGKLMCDRGIPGLVFQGRTVRYNPLPALSIAYPDTETDGVTFTDDDQKLVNIVIAARPGGATQRVISQSSIDIYGPYEQQLDILKTTDGEVLDAASWAVIRYADPQPELRQLPVEAYTMSTAAYRALLAADISTVFTVTGLPDQAPAATATVTVEGYEETITQARHMIDFHTSRTDTDAVWALDDPTYSVLGTTTRLAY